MKQLAATYLLCSLSAACFANGFGSKSFKLDNQYTTISHTLSNTPNYPQSLVFRKPAIAPAIHFQINNEKVTKAGGIIMLVGLGITAGMGIWYLTYEKPPNQYVGNLVPQFGTILGATITGAGGVVWLIGKAGED